MRDGNLYARGSADDKGQMYMHIKAVEALRAVNGTLPVNVKFLIEGEEEVGGESIAKYVAENPAKLKADVALVSDTALYAEGIPTLCIGLRGLIYTEIEATGPDARPALRSLRRRRAERGVRTDRAARESEERRRRHSDPGHLRRRGAARAGGERKLGSSAVRAKRNSSKRKSAQPR